jgi:hypothetical protein
LILLTGQTKTSVPREEDATKLINSSKTKKNVNKLYFALF